MSALPNTAIDPDAAFLPLAMLCRKICVLRARGRSVEASQLQSTEFARTVGDLRAQFGADALPEPRIREILSREQERVDNASVLAELIVNLLPAQPSPATSSAASLASASSARAAAARDLKPETHPTRPPSHSTPTSSPAAPAPPPGIADLLDDMLAQDAKSRRGGSRAA